MSEERRGGVDWMRVLGRIEETLEQSLALACELPAGPALPEGTSEVGNGLLRVLDERLARWEACLHQAEGSAAEVEGVLQEEAEAVQAWLGELARAREKLAGWDQGGV